MRQYKNTNNLIKIFVVFGDFLLLNALLYLFVLLKHYSYCLTDCFAGHLRILFLTANFALAIGEFLFSTIIHERRITYDEILIRVLKLASIQILVMYMALKFSTFSAPVFGFIIIWSLCFPFLLLTSRLIERFFIKRFRSMGKNTHYVLLIGEDPSLVMLYKSLINDASTGYKVLGYYADNEIKDKHEELKHLGTIKELNEKINEGGKIDGADDIFCSLSHTENDEISFIMSYCDHNVVHFFYVPKMVGNFNLNLKLEHLGDIPLFTNYEEPLLTLSNRFIKRVFDIMFSSFILLCLIPFFPIIAIIIKVQSPGPLFFKQDRTGLNGKNFKLYKFRSMHVNSEADKMQATKCDPRKFKFGGFMRKTNIDELPQFLNVLHGDMSVVGPRPHMLYHTKIYSDLIDKYMVRHFAKPGITGWAQVNGWRGETNELWQMEERVKHDIWYIENWSILLDFRIIYRTIRNIITHNDKKAY